ncbi:hypothetical protein JST97_07485 [bacterium]|nr:hypothetical protein [bacterium]
MKRSTWTTTLALALLGAILLGALTRRWVASTTLYIPGANRKLLTELVRGLKTEAVEADAMENLPPPMPDSDWVDVAAAVLRSQDACRYALEHANLSPGLVENIQQAISIPKMSHSTLVLEIEGSSSSQTLNLCNGLLKYYNSDANAHPLTTTSQARKLLKDRCSKLLAEIKGMEKELSRLSNLQTRTLGDKLIRPQGHTKTLIEYQRLARSEAVGEVLKTLREARHSANDGEIARPDPLDPLSASLSDKPGSKLDALARSSLTVRYQDLAERLSLERRYENSVALYRSLQIQSELLATLEAMEERSLEIVEPVTVRRRYSPAAMVIGALFGAGLAYLVSRRKTPNSL